MWTLTLKPKSGSVFPYKPGQFGFLRILGEGISKEEHPFSILSQPGNKEYLTITIKNLGDWTSGVQKIKSGNRALLDAPYGRFSPLLYKRDRGIVLIAGGVGITPMLSILRYFHENGRQQKIVLFWGVNDSSELICSNEFQQFQKDMENYVFIPVMAKEESFEGEKGFVTREKLERLLKATGYDINGPQYFICGPEMMQKSVLGSLKLMGVQKRDVHYESFSL